MSWCLTRSLILSCSCCCFACFFFLSTPAFHLKPLPITAEPHHQQKRDVLFLSSLFLYSPPKKKKKTLWSRGKKLQSFGKEWSIRFLFKSSEQSWKYRPKHLGKLPSDLWLRTTFRTESERGEVFRNADGAAAYPVFFFFYFFFSCGRAEHGKSERTNLSRPPFAVRLILWDATVLEGQSCWFYYLIRGWFSPAAVTFKTLPL